MRFAPSLCLLERKPVGSVEVLWQRISKPQLLGCVLIPAEQQPHV